MADFPGGRALVLELVEGPTLADRIVAGPIPLDEALPIARQIAEALAAAHELGLLHRVINPDNLFVSLPGKGRVAGLKLIDFGLATADKARPEALQQDPSLASDATGGTPLFLAPEIWQGRDPSPARVLPA